MASSWVMVESCDRDHDCRRWEYCAFRDQRVLTEGEYVLIEKVDGEWPEWATASLSDPPLYELSPSAQRELGGDGEAVKVKPGFILDALAGGES